MSEAQKQALSQSMDGKIGQLIDVSIDLERGDAELREQKLQEQIT